MWGFTRSQHCGLVASGMVGGPDENICFDRMAAVAASPLGVLMERLVIQVSPEVDTTNEQNENSRVPVFT